MPDGLWLLHFRCYSVSDLPIADEACASMAVEKFRRPLETASLSSSD
jgi:hypothetical protein